MMRGGLIAALDIGSSKIVCFIAHRQPNGKLKIIGIGHQISQGVKAGIIVDIKKAETSILAAIHAAEKMAQETIDHVLISISGSTIRSHRVDVEISISGQEVTDMDIGRILKQGEHSFRSEEVEALHCIPAHYTIDDTRGIYDPRGMVGEKLRTTLHVVTASATATRNITNCLGRCRLNIDTCIASAYASGIACLTEDEKNLGVILVDIGGGNSAISVFQNGNMIYADNVALGGGHITQDIARGLSTTLTFAERIKTLYGSAIPVQGGGREVIDVSVSDLVRDLESDAIGDVENNGFISKALLTSIIRPRAEEILELVRKNLHASGMDAGLGPRVVITGGASQLQGIRELAGHVFNKHVRLGRPLQIEGLAESTRGPAFSTAIGMLEYARQDMNLVEKGTKERADDRYLGRFRRWVSENF